MIFFRQDIKICRNRSILIGNKIFSQRVFPEKRSFCHFFIPAPWGHARAHRWYPCSACPQRWSSTHLGPTNLKNHLHNSIFIIILGQNTILVRFWKSGFSKDTNFLLTWSRSLTRSIGATAVLEMAAAVPKNRHKLKIEKIQEIPENPKFDHFSKSSHS